MPHPDFYDAYHQIDEDPFHDHHSTHHLTPHQPFHTQIFDEEDHHEDHQDWFRDHHGAGHQKHDPVYDEYTAHFIAHDAPIHHSVGHHGHEDTHTAVVVEEDHKHDVHLPVTVEHATYQAPAHDSEHPDLPYDAFRGFVSQQYDGIRDFHGPDIHFSGPHHLAPFLHDGSDHGIH